MNKPNEVNVTGVAGVNGMIVISFLDYGDENNNQDFELSKEQVKWLRIALKQAYKLAFK